MPFKPLKTFKRKNIFTFQFILPFSIVAASSLSRSGSPWFLYVWCMVLHALMSADHLLFIIVGSKHVKWNHIISLWMSADHLLHRIVGILSKMCVK